eukprot:TRINITY_DN3986_c0_g2_i2.p1 TRINITY_DN3986_c0_g2~~TRINITY_DN3986_c0_g2_i2.p1  ORF type:complete len:169 (+),score=48.45 TRINITY_DN3986_c0_g2_i2:48-509(+)
MCIRDRYMGFKIQINKKRMPPKKKGAKKKKGKKKGTKKKDPSEIQPVINPDALIPKVTVSLRLANPINDILTFDLSVPISTRLEYLKSKIIERHGGAISDVSLCLNSYDVNHKLDSSQTLSEVGVPGGGTVKIYYDYKPLTHPLLLTLSLIHI